MKSTGVVRKVDELGRIVLPKELRTVLGINEKDSYLAVTLILIIIQNNILTGSFTSTT